GGAGPSGGRRRDAGPAPACRCRAAARGRHRPGAPRGGPTRARGGRPADRAGRGPDQTLPGRAGRLRLGVRRPQPQLVPDLVPNGRLRHRGQGAPAHRAAAAGSGGGAVNGLALAPAAGVRLAVAALAPLTAATFLYVTTEMLPVGLLAPIGADLGVSEARVGLLVTAYALVVVVASIPLTYLTRAVPRRVVRGPVLAGYVVSSLGSALAGSYGALMATRVVTALGQAVFWSVVVPIAAGLFPAEVRGRGLAGLVGGAAAGAVAGEPAGGPARVREPAGPAPVLGADRDGGAGDHRGVRLLHLPLAVPDRRRGDLGRVAQRRAAAARAGRHRRRRGRRGVGRRAAAALDRAAGRRASRGAAAAGPPTWPGCRGGPRRADRLRVRRVHHPTVAPDPADRADPAGFRDIGELDRGQRRDHPRRADRQRAAGRPRGADDRAGRGSADARGAGAGRAGSAAAAPMTVHLRQ